MSKEIKYKKTGLPWCPEIPEDWEVKKFNRMAFYQEGPGLRNWQFTNDGVKVICVTNITENGIDFSKLTRNISFEDYNKTYSHFTVNKGDFLLASSGASWGKVAEYKDDEKVILNTSTIRLNSLDENELSREFLQWIIKSSYVSENLNILLTGSCQPNFGPTHLSQLFVVIPPLPQQQSIATYLDRKTTEIDNLISKKQKLIECLKEERMAIINQAVTKGIDPNAQMKDSGIEWLGKIPKHWEVVKFNHYVYLKHGFQFRDNDFTNSGIKIVKITQLKADGTLDTSNSSYIDESRLNDFETIIIKNGDILMALTGGTIGKIVRAAGINETLLQNYRVGNFFPTSKKIEKDFLFWVLSSQVIIEQLFFAQRETGQPNIGKEDFSKMKFALPSNPEQIEISKYLSLENEKFETTISKITMEIELIKEYRTALINEVVTGKKLLN